MSQPSTNQHHNPHPPALCSQLLGFLLTQRHTHHQILLNSGTRLQTLTSSYSRSAVKACYCCLLLLGCTCQLLTQLTNQGTAGAAKRDIFRVLGGWVLGFGWVDFTGCRALCWSLNVSGLQNWQFQLVFGKQVWIAVLWVYIQ